MAGFIGLSQQPAKSTPHAPGMNVVVVALFCVVPICAWALILWAMKGYELDGKRVKEIQAVSACRKEAVEKWKTLDELPAEHRAAGK